MGDNPYHDQGDCAAGTRQRGSGGVDCSSLCPSPHPGLCVGWEARLSPQSDAPVERVSGAGRGSHSHPQEKLGQKLFLKKSRVSSFPSSSQARGGEVMERWAGRRTCLRLGVIPSPGPQPVLASAGGGSFVPPLPLQPHFPLGQATTSWASAGAAALLPPALPARFQPPEAENQPQMWRSSCSWRAPSGDGQGLGTPGQHKGPARWPGPESQELRGVFIAPVGCQCPPCRGCPQGRGDRDTQGLPSPWSHQPQRTWGNSHCPAPSWGYFLGSSLLTGARSPLLRHHPPAGAELSPGGGTAQPRRQHGF